MTPAARVQTAIEILDAIAASARDGGPPADTIFADAMRQRRYAGSKDRRAIRTLVYDVIRTVRALPPSGRAAMLTLANTDAALAALFDGSPYGPAVVETGEPCGEAGLASPALLALFDPLLDDADYAAMLVRAPLDLRVNRLKAARADVQQIFADAAPIAGLADGLRLPPESPAVQHSAYADGLFEVQDAASQHAALALQAEGGMTIVDLCAGAGGKTLALAAGTKDAATLIACDTNRARLQQLPPRALRSGCNSITTRLLNPGQESDMLADLTGKADRVIVDAPCSGSGTWRRSPELRWRLTPSRLGRHIADQARLLTIGAGLVAPGGKLLYAVCSVTKGEGRDQVTAFLAAHPGWSADDDLLPPGIGRVAGDGMLLSPGRDGCDGFFLARLTAPC